MPEAVTPKTSSLSTSASTLTKTLSSSPVRKNRGNLPIDLNKEITPTSTIVSKKPSTVKSPKITNKGVKVYHGTDADFDKFDSKFLGSATKNLKGAWNQPGVLDTTGFSFTTDRDVARGFGKNVKEAYVNITRPYIINGEGKNFMGELEPELKKIIPKIDKTRYDGIIIKNAEDVGPYGYPKVSDHYIPFSEKQIKLSQPLPEARKYKSEEEFVKARGIELR